MSTNVWYLVMDDNGIMEGSRSDEVADDNCGKAIVATTNSVDDSIIDGVDDSIIVDDNINHGVNDSIKDGVDDSIKDGVDDSIKDDVDDSVDGGTNNETIRNEREPPPSFSLFTNMYHSLRTSIVENVGWGTLMK